MQLGQLARLLLFAVADAADLATQVFQLALRGFEGFAQLVVFFTQSQIALAQIQNGAARLVIGKKVGTCLRGDAYQYGQQPDAP